jgi:hypothetical protein
MTEVVGRHSVYLNGVNMSQGGARPRNDLHLLGGGRFGWGALGDYRVRPGNRLVP